MVLAMSLEVEAVEGVDVVAVGGCDLKRYLCYGADGSSFPCLSLFEPHCNR